jgi:hypothetical protein
MSEEHRQLLTKQVREILSVVRTSCTATQAAIAVLSAHEFVERHQLSVSGYLPESVATDGLVIQCEAFPIRQFSRVPRWLKSLMIAVSVVTQTRYCWGRFGLRPFRFGFKGLDVDAEAGGIALRYLMTQMGVQLLLRLRSERIENRRRFSSSYRNGFASGVMSRAIQVIEERQADLERNELAEFKRMAIVHRYGPSLPGKQMTARDIARYWESTDFEAHEVGWQDGKRAQFAPNGLFE